MKNLDLRVIGVLRELQRTGSVSHASQNLGLSQSAVSMSLARLRKEFNDPLFVRTSRGMEPTPYARELITELNRIAEMLESTLGRRPHFAPSTSERMFHLMATDLTLISLLPPLIQRLTAVAPRIRIALRPLSNSLPRILESGEIDLAIGAIPQLGAGFCQQNLFASQYRCAVSRTHPRIQGVISMEQFQRETHIWVTTPGTGHKALEKALEAKKIRRHIGMRIPSFMGIGAILAASEHLAIVPGWFGSLLANDPMVQVLPLPFSIPGYTVTQNWHERYSHDPALQWFRSTISSLFEVQPSITPSGVRSGASARRKG
jgi:DNA-binding transcriptional LysR family regulator